MVAKERHSSQGGREPGWRSRLMTDLRKSSKFQEGLRAVTERKSVTSRIEYFLFLRGAIVEEVAQIVGKTTTQVSDFRDYLRDRKIMEKSTTEKESEAKRKAHLGKPRNTRGREYSPQQRNTFSFVGKLCTAGFVTNDLSSWDGLRKIYQTHGRELPVDFANKLRLEVFMLVTMLAERGDSQLLSVYRSFGNGIDPEWFSNSLVQEEQFIKEKISRRKG